MLSRAVKSRISAILVFAMLSTLILPFMAAAATATFKDTANSYAKQEIQALADAGIFSGYEDNSFQPTKAMTRAELAKIFVMSLGLTVNPAKAAAFQDVPADAWYSGYVGALVESGITQGTSSSTFSPENKVTREELAVFFIRAMGLEETAKKVAADAKLADLGQVSDWAKPAVSLAFKIGFLQGIEENGVVKFSPRENAERQALARLAYEFTMNKAKYTEKAKDLAAKGNAEPAASPSPSPSSAATSGGGGGGGSKKDDTHTYTVESVQALDNQTVEVTFTSYIQSVGEVKSFAIDGGLSVLNATPKVGSKTVTLTTTAQKVGQPYTLTYNYASTGKTFVGTTTPLTTINADTTYTGTFGFNKAGTYGPESGTATVNGSVYIQAEGVTLRNLVINGDLTFASSLGEGDATLDGVTVNGQTIVNGGGPNSIHLQNSVLVSVIVNKQTGAVRLVVEGSTSVQVVDLQSSVTLQESNVTGEGFRNVTIARSMPANSTVSLRGVFETVDVIATNISVSVPNGLINRLTVNDSAANTNINLGSASVTQMELFAMASIFGPGIVHSAAIHVPGVGFETAPVSSEGEQYQALPSSGTWLQNITLANGSIGLTFSQPVTDAVYSDFAVTASLNGQPYQLNNLTYIPAEHRFTFDVLPADVYSLQTLSVTVSPAENVTKFVHTASGSLKITGFAGTIYDVNNNPVAGMTIKFRKGIGATVGSVMATVVTDSNGRYKVTLPAGSYTGELSADGFIPTYLVGVAADNLYDTNQNATAIRIAGDSETRIVLTWQENPRDLDSHLVGPQPDAAGTFHTWFAGKQYTYNSVVYDDLDHDDVTSYGPETTTIRHDVYGTYRFYVHHYSGSATLRTSGAEVKIYRGSSAEPVRSFTVPTGTGTEMYWAVFELNLSESGMTITEVNRLYTNEFEAAGTTGNIATVTSGLYTVNSTASTISNVPAGTSVASFKAGLSPVNTGVTFNVYGNDGTTIKTGTIETGDKVIVTAANSITKKIYTVSVGTSSAATVTGLVYTNAVTVTGATYQMALSASYSNNTTVNVTNNAVWSSSNTSVATINAATGLLTAVTNGTTVVSATYGGRTALYNVTVNGPVTVTGLVYDAAVSVTQATYQMALSATFSDSTASNVSDRAVWSSSDTTVATIEPTTGLLHVLSNGTVVITAIYGGRTAVYTLTINVPTP